MKMTMQANVINVSFGSMPETNDQGHKTGKIIHFGKIQVLEPQPANEQFAGSKVSTLKIAPENPEDIGLIGSRIQAAIAPHNGAPVSLQFEGGQRVETITKYGKTESVSVLVVTDFQEPKSK
nr:hypothetical protein 6 [Piscirickettsiaceae bacterium]